MTMEVLCKRSGTEFPRTEKVERECAGRPFVPGNLCLIRVLPLHFSPLTGKFWLN